MHVDTETLPALRIATIRHTGPYNQIGRAFEQLHEIVSAAKLPHRELVGVYYDDPQTTPVGQLRADAGVIVDDGVVLPQGLVEQRIPGGRYARVEHAGSYERLGDTWAQFKRAVAAINGQPSARGFTFELYRNTPMQVPEDQLRTALYMSAAEVARHATP
jgi:AraC family transcriptional regulator